MAKLTTLGLLLLLLGLTSVSYHDSMSVVIYEKQSQKKFEVLSNEQFNRDYPNVNWMHIGRLKNANPSINLKEINESFDFSKVHFLHDEKADFAYRLYDGNFLFCRKM